MKSMTVGLIKLWNSIKTNITTNFKTESSIYQTQNGLLISGEFQDLQFVFGSVFVCFLATSFQEL